MITINYDPATQVPPIKESDIDRKVFIAFVSDDTIGVYVSILKTNPLHWVGHKIGGESYGPWLEWHQPEDNTILAYMCLLWHEYPQYDVKVYVIENKQELEELITYNNITNLDLKQLFIEHAKEVLP